MKSYVWLTFAFLGWGYYEMSGGADFVPAERDVAETAQIAAPEIVTRADTTTLLSVSSSNVAAEPVISQAAVLQAAAQATNLDSLETVAVEPVSVAVDDPVLDLREVVGSRVNVRMGPGTGFDVITTLNAGAKLEVLGVDPDGWANVSLLDNGIEGWMAERLLTDPDL